MGSRIPWETRLHFGRLLGPHFAPQMTPREAKETPNGPKWSQKVCFVKGGERALWATPGLMQTTDCGVPFRLQSRRGHRGLQLFGNCLRSAAAGVSGPRLFRNESRVGGHFVGGFSPTIWPPSQLRPTKYSVSFRRPRNLESARRCLRFFLRFAFSKKRARSPLRTGFP